MNKLERLFNNCAYKVKYKQTGDSVNYAFVEGGRATLYIYFQGSNSISDWVRNFLFGKKPYSDMTVSYRVHRGFLAAWEEVKSIIEAKITERELRDPTKDEYDDGYEQVMDYRWKHIIVVGYSHGAALAGLCHEFVWFHRPDLRQGDLEGYGFESPRFYAGFRVKKALEERWKNFTVVRCNNDIVTHCPPAIFGYCHVGRLLKVKGDTSMVKNHHCKCVKSHYPEVVLDALKSKEE